MSRVAHKGYNIPRSLRDELAAYVTSRGWPQGETVEWAVRETAEYMPVVYGGDVRDHAADHSRNTEWSSVQIRKDSDAVDLVRQLAKEYDISMDEIVRRSIRWLCGLDRDVGTRVVVDGSEYCLVRDLGPMYQVRDHGGREHFYDAERCRIEPVPTEREDAA